MSAAPPNWFVCGIRHHGPGSARSLRATLAALNPDCLLIEGPPEAEEVLALAARPEMKPPVALLIHDPEQPRRAVYYPFARFSPEWVAIQWGLSRQVPVRFMDLPQSIQMGLAAAAEAAAPADAGEIQPEPAEAGQGWRQDPLRHLAQAAGYSDSERWWEHLVEQRDRDADIFPAILEAMTALRESEPEPSGEGRDLREARREAHMRQTIRAAQKEGFQRIAVVCGAWHAPALASLPPAKGDAALLKGLPRRKVAVTWVPWTYSRLALGSGYGAGIESPGWYDYLWSLEGGGAQAVAVGWMVKVAHLLREQDLDASPASVIEAVRLAETLAALRHRPVPGLPEMNEAIQTVFCFGDALPLRLIGEKLIVSEQLGAVPEDTPMVPLARDLAREQKRLRLPPEASQRSLDLDLRQPGDLERSHLLHRLNLLHLPWGARERHPGNQKGTFHERWGLQWKPEFSVALIEASVWGNTVPAAAAGQVRHAADAADLAALTGLLEAVLLADLPTAATHLMGRLQDLAASACEVALLMDALPALARILRYGNVRRTDTALVGQAVSALVIRICIGLPGACGSLNEEAADAIHQKILATHEAIGLLQNEGHQAAWYGTLRQLADLPKLHGLVAGRACRLLLDARQWEAAEVSRRLGLALSPANPPAAAAAWVDGLLRDSGLLLLHDDTLWQVFDEWLTGLAPDHFTGVLPLLRRTFATFAAPERRQMGGRVARGRTPSRSAAVADEDFDEESACGALALAAQLLGLSTGGDT